MAIFLGKLLSSVTFLEESLGLLAAFFDSSCFAAACVVACLRYFVFVNGSSGASFLSSRKSQ